MVVDSAPYVAQGLGLVFMHLDEQLQVHSEGRRLHRNVELIGR
jgi:hypothetical protein